MSRQGWALAVHVAVAGGIIFGFDLSFWPAWFLAMWCMAGGVVFTVLDDKVRAYMAAVAREEGDAFVAGWESRAPQPAEDRPQRIERECGCVFDMPTRPMRSLCPDHAGYTDAAVKPPRIAGAYLVDTPATGETGGEG